MIDTGSSSPRVTPGAASTSLTAPPGDTDAGTDTLGPAVRVLSIANAIRRRAAGHLCHAPVRLRNADGGPTSLALALRLLPKDALTVLDEMPLYDATRAVEGHIADMALRRPEALRLLTRALATDTTPFRPIPGDQSRLYEAILAPDHADEVCAAGSSGTGKSLTALMAGARRSKAMRVLRKSQIEFTPMLAELAKYVGSYDGLNRGSMRWALPRGWGRDDEGTVVELASMPDNGGELPVQYQGRSWDTSVYDDAASGWLNLGTVDFLGGWGRTTVPGLRPITIYSANPPTSTSGEWLRTRFAPWLESSHPRQAAEGEMLHMIGSDVVAPGTPGATRRTCIKSRLVTSNPYLMASNYLDRLNAISDTLLKAKLVDNDWDAQGEDHPLQVLPARLVDEAMARWTPHPPPSAPMRCIGVDVARSVNRDKTALVVRHADWFGPVQAFNTTDGQQVAAAIMAVRAAGNNPNVLIAIDVVGVGASPFDLIKYRCNATPINHGAATQVLDASGSFTFSDTRSMLWWKLREALQSRPLALPPDKVLRAELITPRFELRGGKLKVESRDEIIKRLGRSPDRATAVIQALIEPSHNIARPRGEFSRAYFQPVGD